MTRRFTMEQEQEIVAAVAAALLPLGTVAVDRDRLARLVAARVALRAGDTEAVG